MTNNKTLLEIKNLNASVADTQILKDFNLTINMGEKHTIMGPNGSGKSTLANILAGNPEYFVNSGEINFLGQTLIDKDPEIRACLGLFLAFQYPVELPGVRMWQFLKSSLDSQREYNGKDPLSTKDFDSILNECAEKVDISQDFLKRNVNEGFSGGEKKRNEILQLSLINPKLAILDETDSGLDIDALKIVSNGIENFSSSNNSILLVTHYQRILDYVKPDYVHVMIDGKIVKSGDKSLALELDKKGYDWLSKK
ncbi:MAG: Fe-S cluster assembly ATPase SufC [SAR202 cluster bacterium]|nr:Fe-S cluster assembly ATPase SufC [SAR202 cluster bacterium]|tara:strand:- start:656 stop:1417 length:762 start_codon:yes stop_codon:yes gene_type:complete